MNGKQQIVGQVIFISIDSYVDKTVSGRLWYGCMGEETPFTNLMQLLLLIDKIMEETGFPEAQLRCKRFAGIEAIAETSVSGISGMSLSTTYSASGTEGQTANTNVIPVGDGIESSFTVINTYSPIYYPPETPSPSPSPSEPPETEIPEESPPLNPSPDPSEGPGTDIPEESPPLGPGPGGTEIPDAETPLDAAPQTGDNSQAAPFVILALLSVFGIGALSFIGKKKKHN